MKIQGNAEWEDEEMVTHEFSKPTRRRMVGLVDRLYQAALGEALKELDREFGLWREGKLLPSDLAVQIHKFQQGAARELWNVYVNRPHAASLVAEGVRAGKVRLEEVPEEARERVEGLAKEIGKRESTFSESASS